MKSFIKNLFTVAIFLAGFFVFSGSPSAEACEIVPSGTSARPPVGSISLEYTDNFPDFYYFDITTQNCINNNLKIEVFDLRISDPQNPVLIKTANLYIRPPGTPAPTSENTFQTSEDQFTVPMQAGEDLCEVPDFTMIGYAAITAIPIFGTLFSGYQAVFQEHPPECMLYFKISVEGGGNYSLGSEQNLAIVYDCYGGCDTPFVFNGPNNNGSYCPVTSEPLDYGAVCNLNTNNQVIQTSGGLGGGGLVSSEYSIEPLAPLPGLTGTPNLGQLFEAFFTILIVIAGILALIMIVVGGITYITSESFGGKGKGKAYIINAIVGLILALGAWVILNTINPDLAEDLSISIPMVSLEGDTDIFTNTFTSGTTAFTIPSDLESSLAIQCPLSGGSGSVPSIIDSFVGKTTYRFGGKGGHLPQGQNFTSSNGNSSSCTNDTGEQQQCGSFCPSGSICLDCSGFVNHVRRCAALQTYGGTSSMVGHQNARPVDMSTLSANGQSLTVEGQPYDLVPGDILVWNGHVVVYYGGGQIAESQGSKSGLIKNSNIKKSSLAQSSYKNRITHIIKVNP